MKRAKAVLIQPTPARSARAPVNGIHLGLAGISFSTQADGFRENHQLFGHFVHM